MTKCKVKMINQLTNEESLLDGEIIGTEKMPFENIQAYIIKTEIGTLSPIHPNNVTID